MQTVPTAMKADKPVASRLITADELWRLTQDDQCYELIKGALTKISPAGPRHGRIAMRLGSLLEQFARQKELGVVYAAETGFKLSENPDTVRAADAAFVAQNRIPTAGEPEGYWAIAPDLVVEFVSLSDAAAAVQAKVTAWLIAGCRIVWVVYPDTQTITDYRSLTDVRILTSQDKLTGGDVLPGFTCLISELFA